MKSKIIIAVISMILIFIGINAIAQIDSTTIQNTISTGFQIVSAENDHIVPNVPNSVTGALLTLIAGVVIRLIEKRQLRKKNKLNDKKDDSIYRN